MKTLQHHTLLYDQNCPLCVGYSNAFIRYGLLDKNGRENFTEKISIYSQVNPEKAKNEIALINQQTGEVTYGIHSLIKIIGNQSQWIRLALNWKPILFLLAIFYSFISYNRKIIVGKTESYCSQECQPSFHMGYRAAYILCSAIITSSILFQYSGLLLNFIPHSSYGREYMICFGQIIFQSLLLIFTSSNRKMIWNYIGNMMTVSLIGSFLLLPGLLLAHYFSFSYIALGYFMMVVLFMFFSHVKRVKENQSPVWLSYTWVLYRILVLIMILYV